MSEKLCIFCKHFWFSEGSPGYSELTPGYEANIDCHKRHFDLRLIDMSESDFRRTLLLARTCADYVPDTGKME